MNEEKRGKTLYEKLFGIFQGLSAIPKTDKGGKYNYVSSSDVLNKVRALMVQAGVILIPNIRSAKYTSIVVKEGQSATLLTELYITYTWVNVDNPTDRLILDFYGQGVDISGEKGVGKALTYSEKYFLLKFFNIPTDEVDPDDVNNQFTNDIINPPKGQKLKNPTPIKDLEIIEALKAKTTLSGLNAFYSENKNSISDKNTFNKIYAETAKRIRGIK